MINPNFVADIYLQGRISILTPGTAGARLKMEPFVSVDHYPKDEESA
jgi:hypothetical protein